HSGGQTLEGLAPIVLPAVRRRADVETVLGRLALAKQVRAARDRRGAVGVSEGDRVGAAKAAELTLAAFEMRITMGVLSRVFTLRQADGLEMISNRRAHDDGRGQGRHAVPGAALLVSLYHELRA